MRNSKGLMMRVFLLSAVFLLSPVYMARAVDSYADMVERLMPSVVNISTERNTIATDEESELIRNIIKTRKDLEFANNNYEFADSDLIDYYIYEIKANQAKLNYLIKMAKIKGLSVHFIKELEYRLSTDEENAI